MHLALLLLLLGVRAVARRRRRHLAGLLALAREEDGQASVRRPSDLWWYGTPGARGTSATPRGCRGW
ncbi:hypothetical protein ACGGAQ_21595 [Micromonospora sp. NPDC047557]|uniref:hypothetical protein n=1 Tax=Micromonospora sp. NPDC047557 TaxID=3364250 RepID=UPI0037111B44